ncbi:MAG: glycosyltransferase [bacterium]|nr:glycosyltransferase [bacterium]
MNTNITSNLHDIIVFCHLRWEFVIQRPQHIINRLAQDRKVLFVEEPLEYDEMNKGTFNTLQPSKNLTVIQPRIPWGDFADILGPMVSKRAKDENITKPIIWLYSAAFMKCVDAVEHSLLVYDCMDELSAFKGAPAELISMEKELLERADVVFTGGKSLYESKNKLNANIHCFPSSVDQVHFEKALVATTEIPEDISVLTGTVVGYYGVIDERIDLDLLEKVANKMQEIQFVMIGPIVKISEADLPRTSNIHYLGSKPYAQLPNYLKRIDIAMMPFALNESTKFISPTKTLEYMAAHKPIISTAIYDVVRDYSNEVTIINNPDEFIQAINTYIAEPTDQKEKRVILQKAVINRTSWDNTVDQMKKIIEKTLSHK